MENNKNMELNPIYCKICGNAFTAEEVGKHHYITTEKTVNLLTSVKSTKYYDTFDCPVCKCQNILGERYKKHIIFASKNIPDEVVFAEKEEQPECYGDFVKESKGCSVCKMKTKCKNETNPKCFGEYTEKNIACVEKCKSRDSCEYYTAGKTDGK